MDDDDPTGAMGGVKGHGPLGYGANRGEEFGKGGPLGRDFGSGLEKRDIPGEGIATLTNATMGLWTLPRFGPDVQIDLRLIAPFEVALSTPTGRKHFGPFNDPHHETGLMIWVGAFADPSVAKDNEAVGTERCGATYPRFFQVQNRIVNRIQNVVGIKIDVVAVRDTGGSLSAILAHELGHAYSVVTEPKAVSKGQDENRDHYRKGGDDFNAAELAFQKEIQEMGGWYYLLPSQFGAADLKQ